ncbi:MAG TPA: serine hydrolase [Gammaproteobacteria bacterium]|nr:serine hydrolase [Gammaproteobacteria bacterium]
MRKFLSAFLCVSAASITGFAAAQDRSVADYIAAIEGAQSEPGANGLGDLTIEELMARFNVPGVSVAAIRDFEIHWAKGYGVADVETGQAVDTETLFQAASISKPVAAMGVLEAVEDEVFGLDDDINDILTSWQLDGGGFTRDRPVTPRSLTSHNSGLGDGFGFPGYDPAGPIPTVVQILDGEPPSNTRPLFMERPPFSLTEYSGGGATLMQQALEDARGRPFEEILRDDVLLPIGMADSTFEQPLPPDRDRNAARAHDGEGRSRGAKWHVYPEMAAAGLWTTPGDLARFAIEVQKSAIGESNEVLSRAMVQEMLTPVGVGDFAVGFNVQKMGQGWYFSHGGSNWGFQGTLLAHKLHGYGLAIMTNADRGGAVMQELSQRIQRAYEWDSLAQPAPRGYDPPPDYEAIELPPEVLEEYVGEYQLNEATTVVIALENGALLAGPAGQPLSPLFAMEVDHFFLRVAPVEVLFTRDADGAVTSLTVLQGGQGQEAPKVR